MADILPVEAEVDQKPLVEVSRVVPWRKGSRHHCLKVENRWVGGKDELANEWESECGGLADPTNVQRNAALH